VVVNRGREIHQCGRGRRFAIREQVAIIKNVAVLVQILVETFNEKYYSV